MDKYEQKSNPNLDTLLNTNTKRKMNKNRI